MIREVELKRYLPPFLQEYEELSSCLNAEDPEFILVWNGTERVLKNAFIETADEYGLKRFEKLLGIFPSKEDDIESRRSRIFSRWFTTLPYTFRVFIRRMELLCGGRDFIVTKYFTEEYRLEIESYMEQFGQVAELEHMIDTIVPCNMVVNVLNRILCSAEGKIGTAGVICAIETALITNDFQEAWRIDGQMLFGARAVVADFFTVQ